MLNIWFFFSLSKNHRVCLSQWCACGYFFPCSDALSFLSPTHERSLSPLLCFISIPTKIFISIPTNYCLMLVSLPQPFKLQLLPCSCLYLTVKLIFNTAQYCVVGKLEYLLSLVRDFCYREVQTTDRGLRNMVMLLNNVQKCFFPEHYDVTVELTFDLLEKS